MNDGAAPQGRPASSVPETSVTPRVVELAVRLREALGDGDVEFAWEVSALLEAEAVGLLNAEERLRLRRAA
jgi:hypothetical protein